MQSINLLYYVIAICNSNRGSAVYSWGALASNIHRYILHHRFFFSETLLKCNRSTDSQESCFVCPHIGTAEDQICTCWCDPQFLGGLHLRLWGQPCSVWPSEDEGTGEPQQTLELLWVTFGLWGALQVQTLSCSASGFLMQMQCVLSRHKWWSFTDYQWWCFQKITYFIFYIAW